MNVCRNLGIFEYIYGNLGIFVDIVNVCGYIITDNMLLVDLEKIFHETELFFSIFSGEICLFLYLIYKYPQILIDIDKYP